MANEYTPEMESELVALSPVDNDKAIAFAEKYGLSPASVRQKCVRSDVIEYLRKPTARKDGSPVEKKADIVAEIATLLGSDADTFETLGNANRHVLVAIRRELTIGANAQEQLDEMTSEIATLLGSDGESHPLDFS